MGNDSYALSHMNVKDIPVRTTVDALDHDFYLDNSTGQFARRLTHTATAAELNYNDITTLGTGATSKAVVLDSGEDYVWPATGILTYGVLKDPAGTTLGATVAEINNACDVSTRLVTIADATNTLTLGATHVNRIAYVLDATLAITLPEATGTGNSYTILQGIAATSSTIVTADTTNCGFHGFLMGSDTDAAGTYSWTAVGTEDTITLNGVATGGKLGDWIRVTDIATDKWLVEGNIRQSGASEATPFSSAA